MYSTHLRWNITEKRSRYIVTFNYKNENNQPVETKKPTDPINKAIEPHPPNLFSSLPMCSFKNFDLYPRPINAIQTI